VIVSTDGVLEMIMSRLLTKLKQNTIKTYHRKILKNGNKDDNNQDLDEVWARSISITADTKEETTVNLFYNNVSLTVSEDENYAQKLATICESSRIKEELGEELLWQYKDEKGIFFKKIKEMVIITNYRIMYFNTNNQEIIQFPLKYADIAVVNAKTISWRHGSAAGGFTRSAAFGLGFFNSEGTSRQVGDLWFLFQGQKVIELTNIVDPNGVKHTLEMIKKQLHNSEKEKTTYDGRQK
jgi:hypothetical protein